MPTKTKKQSPIQPKPRPALTTKRRAAIHAYTTHRCRNKMDVTSIIEQTIRTERLTPEELYSRLENLGFRYMAKLERWLHTERRERIRQMARENGYQA